MATYSDEELRQSLRRASDFDDWWKNDTTDKVRESIKHLAKWFSISARNEYEVHGWW